MAYIYRMRDCILELRLRVRALILLFLSILLSFAILHVGTKICVRVLSRSVDAGILKLEIHMSNELLDLVK